MLFVMCKPCRANFQEAGKNKQSLKSHVWLFFFQRHSEYYRNPRLKTSVLLEVSDQLLIRTTPSRPKAGDKFEISCSVLLEKSSEEPEFRGEIWKQLIGSPFIEFSATFDGELFEESIYWRNYSVPLIDDYIIVMGTKHTKILLLSIQWY